MRVLLAILSLGATCLVLVSCKYKGCTDDKANNYSAQATSDDGSCTYDEPAGALSLTVWDECSTNNGIDFSAGSVSCAGCSQDTSAISSDILFTAAQLKVVPGDSCWGKDNLGIVNIGHVCCLGGIHTLPSSSFGMRWRPPKAMAMLSKPARVNTRGCIL
jgi:hypothetical protein